MYFTLRVLFPSNGPVTVYPIKNLMHPSLLSDTMVTPNTLSITPFCHNSHSKHCPSLHSGTMKMAMITPIMKLFIFGVTVVTKGTDGHTLVYTVCRCGTINFGVTVVTKGIDGHILVFIVCRCRISYG